MCGLGSLLTPALLIHRPPGSESQGAWWLVAATRAPQGRSQRQEPPMEQVSVGNNVIARSTFPSVSPVPDRFAESLAIRPQATPHPRAARAQLQAGTAGPRVQRVERS